MLHVPPFHRRSIPPLGGVLTEAIWWPKRGGTLGWVLSVLGSGTAARTRLGVDVRGCQSQRATRRSGRVCQKAVRPPGRRDPPLLIRPTSAAGSPRPCMNPLRS